MLIYAIRILAYSANLPKWTAEVRWLCGHCKLLALGVKARRFSFAYRPKGGELGRKQRILDRRYFAGRNVGDFNQFHDLKPAKKMRQ